MGLLDQPLLEGRYDERVGAEQARWDVLGERCLRECRGLLEDDDSALALFCAFRLVQQDPMREGAWEILRGAPQ
ncbi:hypothetical protein LX15_004815 [Streptoalloteichus tenebrarius]|uniref:Uncharacterized protein n=1 Tax=Streptoalloteichus tenebrarius (strain ATCC 17920 / DSM 40477 / JCM 4838 / CBS 697.72 / NBRC 16177 / NCIMB 11028 / NRRL B-12390 / A12253. 1 / ISP 5477) TaxID=1933 RepID=A0ABT1I0G6_STRSD|nr:hypothetical protein [Streptoalloteichus tenebrarius]BFF03997.1 hypothetical protein GCM10020241_56720 [Streptoalloteichus tenebrarius]